MLPDGQRHLIGTTVFGSKLYSLYLIPDRSVDSYYVNIVIGQYDAPTPVAIASVILTGIDKQKTPEEGITKVLTIMNAKLKEYFGIQPVPVTWEEKFEALLKKLAFFLQDGIPQIKES